MIKKHFDKSLGNQTGGLKITLKQLKINRKIARIPFIESKIKRK